MIKQVLFLFTETEVKTSLAPVVEGARGDWSSAVYCPYGEFATGYKMQIWVR